MQHCKEEEWEQEQEQEQQQGQGKSGKVRRTGAGETLEDEDLVTKKAAAANMRVTKL